MHIGLQTTDKVGVEQDVRLSVEWMVVRFHLLSIQCVCLLEEPLNNVAAIYVGSILSTVAGGASWSECERDNVSGLATVMSSLSSCWV